MSVRDKKENMERAVFGGGCFWCTEAVFQMIKGIRSVRPGYAGGESRMPPRYEDVATGATGYAEVAEVIFDPATIAYRDLLAVFFATHDPTSLNRQGNDAGTQYRSAIFYTTAAQQREAEAMIRELNVAHPEGKPVVTEVRPLKNFYAAEDYHRDYYKNNPQNAYCQVVINPKLKKVQERFAALLAGEHG